MLEMELAHLCKLLFLRSEYVASHKAGTKTSIFRPTSWQCGIRIVFTFLLMEHLFAVCIVQEMLPWSSLESLDIFVIYVCIDNRS